MEGSDVWTWTCVFWLVDETDSSVTVGDGNTPGRSKEGMSHMLWNVVSGIAGSMSDGDLEKFVEEFCRFCVANAGEKTAERGKRFAGVTRRFHGVSRLKDLLDRCLEELGTLNLCGRC